MTTSKPQRKTKSLIWIWLLVIGVITPLLPVQQTTVQASGYMEWQDLGSPGFSAGEVNHTSIAIDNSGTPYVVYDDGGNSSKATVMKFNGSSWEPVGSPGFSAGRATSVSIALDSSGSPYVAYRDGGNSGKATVMKFNGSSWEPVGSPGFSAGEVNHTSIAIDNRGTPYVVYGDGGNSYKATVMTYNGIGWETVGNAGFSAGEAASTSIALDSSGTPYVVYGDAWNSNKATVMTYNGISWEPVGNGSFSAGVAFYTSIALDSSGTPYVVYSDEGTSYKATVMKYDGSSWAPVGNAGFSASRAVGLSMALDSSGTPYVVYSEEGTGYKGVVMQYDGSSWETVGNGSFSGDYQAASPSIALDSSGTPYVVFRDNEYSFKATVMKYSPVNLVKEITGFAFDGLMPAVTGAVYESAKTIALTVPYGTDVTALVPTITHTGASVSPASGMAQDFTTPVTYTVTAEDGSMQQYVVTVTVNDAVVLPQLPVLTAQGDGVNNLVKLQWTSSLAGQEYYMVYQKDSDGDGLNDYQSIPLKTNIKVLNVYPDIAGSDGFQSWMQSVLESAPDDYDMEVDKVSLTDFNGNDTNTNYAHYLARDSDGVYGYDVLYFGAWDSNNHMDLSAEAHPAVEGFIQQGGGVLFGHDTAGFDHFNFIDLAQKYLKLDVRHDQSELVPTIGSSNVVIQRRGFPMNYPFALGDVGDILITPESHSFFQFARGDIWFKFTNPSWGDKREIDTLDGQAGTNNFYLTTWNNTALIQTGHRNGEATADEQKILANTLFYLAQKSTANQFDDRKSQDVASPNTVSGDIAVAAGSSADKKQLSWTAAEDNGSSYHYYLKAFSYADGSSRESTPATATVTTGMKGYAVVVDEDPGTAPGNAITTTTASFEVGGLQAGRTYYAHIKAIDNAGNESTVSDIAFTVDAGRLTVSSVDPVGVQHNGKTQIAASAGAGNRLVYINLGQGEAVIPTQGEILTGYTDLPTGGIIPAAHGDLIAVAELDAAGRVLHFNTVKAIVIATVEEEEYHGGGYAGNPAAPVKSAEILINGKTGYAGTVTQTTEHSRSLTTIDVDQTKLRAMLGAEGSGAVVTIPWREQSDIVIGQLTGDMIQEMERREATLVLDIPTGSYRVPAEQLRIASLAKQFGDQVKLEDVQLQVRIEAADSAMVQAAKHAGEAYGVTLAAPPVTFTVYAMNNGNRIEITDYSVYVERTVALPEGMGPNRITTGVVLEKDGTLRHVPTKVTKVKDTYYAVMNSLTNSAYGVIWNPVTFDDMAGHWAEAAVNNMGSRLVVNGGGDGRFNPDADITRAEFAAIVVRGLGLRAEPGHVPFTDVISSEWYAGFVATAADFGLIAGYEDGSFRPQSKITRQEAMTMMARAMQMTGLKEQLAESGRLANALASFEDADDVAAWAKEGANLSVASKVMNGRTMELLKPQASITRAEVAVTVQRLLQYSNLIEN